jgi:type 1 glutamine amidotransferase
MKTKMNPTHLAAWPWAALVSACALLAMAAGSVLSAAEPPAGIPGSTNHPARVLLVTGVDYPGHLWRQTSPVLAEAIRKDRRLEVFTVEDPHFLDSAALARYDVVVLHFENWQQPGPGTSARANLQQFVEGGKGLVLLHFACGAWHDEWPEFVNLAGRVWAGLKGAQHDPFGPFRVEIVEPDDPLVRGMADFETQDELYTCLVGDVPIKVLAQAKSKVDGKYHPMAFTTRCGQGRSFQCPLGHNAAALSVPEVQELFRRACAWAAGLPPVAPQR